MSHPSFEEDSEDEKHISNPMEEQLKIDIPVKSREEIIKEIRE